MRTIIAGSRDIDSVALVNAAVVASGFDVTEVVSGCARGVDRAAIRWAEEKGLPVIRVPADWSRGRSAGMQRNAVMAREKGAERLIAIWDGKSPGTRGMIGIGSAALGAENVYVHLIGQFAGPGLAR